MAQFYPPLKERVFKSKSTYATVDTSTATTTRGAYKGWNENNMVQAVDSVLKKGASIRSAAVEFDIPRSTLSDRISGRVLMGAVSGPNRYLNTQQEEELVHFLLECASIGYPRSRQEVIGMVQRVLNDSGIQKTVTHGWWESFCHRHPNIALRTTASLSLSRAKTSDICIINKYFDLLQSTIDEYDLNDKPCQLFNMDETGMPLNPKPLKMVCATGSKNPVSITSGNKSQITVVGCVNAAGYCIPPMVIYGGRKTLSAALVQNEIPGTIYGLSSKGWIDQDLFDQWFDHFLCYAPSARPLLLMLDGHSSHYCPNTIHRASENEVILLALPPNTTHLTQPLDKGIYGPLKVEWRKLCHEYIVQNPGKVVTQNNFSTLFSKAWMKSMTITNIIAGFSTTGIYPIDRNKVISRLEEAMCTPPKQPSGLSYLPLLTPVPTSSRRSSKRPVVFSEAEIKLFLERYEDGYDGGDERYKIWLEMYHPNAESIGSASLNESVFHTPKGPKNLEGSKSTHAVSILKPMGTIKKLFCQPMPPSTLPTKTEKSSARVLTSSEALKLLKEKEEKKNAVKQQKELQQKKREEKLRQQSQRGKHNAKNGEMCKLSKQNHDIKESVEESVEEKCKINDNQSTKSIKDKVASCIYVCTMYLAIYLHKY